MHTPPAASSAPAARIADLWRNSLRPTTTTPAPGVVSLAMGEPDFDTPPVIVEAAIEALRDGHTHYTDFAGDAELREAIARRAAAIARREITRESIVVTHGASGGLAATVLGLVNPGDRVIIPSPTYSLYADLVRLAGGVPVFLPLRRDFHLDTEALADALPGARLLIVCNPGNPTGAVLRRDELDHVANLLHNTETLLVADEAYEALDWSEHGFVSALSIEALADHLVHVQTYSKTYAMTGWRIGHVTAPPAAAKAIATTARTVNGAPNSAVQRAALAATRHGRALTEPMVAEYRKRRDLMLAALEATPGVDVTAPEGAFYLFIRYHNDIPSASLAESLAGAGVLVRPGAEYGPGGEGHLRLSYAAAPDAITTGCSRLHDFFTAHLPR
ncbi:pyridoxal phosphate-dependent aminotransferase [Saccharopolyspora spinosa]|uniref:Aspartate aminotransferase n=1 Tax=Saccharopolyspora spinosa TaxID=60894 RepID=A0A2N3Y121_SACSN|nr:aminotransferase class I/II-fold pyridoxal phosphate-dependent enzyme [Saccharopolyspora spinosa]PKW16590.1 aspartate aminotransferase [Saccharopolyspora spinosa]